ncbi:Mrp/NBP35 family ATP-binding protein [Alkaliphilus hydrothermalis]|uniref:Iron-sulfur cluster carrier protein n=1 Tax=Alkaliphilus hydrothermalis TaxID=1482730 RepID=A0ABS2NQM5_9FIRM|nr:Mrp/NBP35 family ATP-binding protein [Alkaliphilus hydrothermalis]MBM7615263.1 Mrp family chromosome partitioning ATPase [Alkaliphilus hydrothermalis]
MEKCQGCNYYQNGKCGTSTCIVEEGNPLNKIKHVIGIMSGKGGVGKSTVTALLANALKKNGNQVGILDGDITGPSIAKIFGIKGPVLNSENGVIPAETENKVKIMSMNLLLPKESDPVIWRGPVVAGVINQFWNDVIWGELDYLLIDLPPGTGDVALTVMQSIPVDGIIMVTSPQSLVHMIVKKGIKMTQKMDKKILGVIENMSYVQPPGYPEPYYLFGKGKTEEVVKQLGLEFLGGFPIEKEMVELADQGAIHKYDNQLFKQLADKVETTIK